MSKIKMPKKLRKQWLKALRSGRYKQTSNELHSSNNENCCLGVLGRCLLIPKSKLMKGGMPSGIDEKYVIKFPSAIVKKKRKVFHDTNFAGKLAKMNDGGSNFQDISDYIEKRTIGV